MTKASNYSSNIKVPHIVIPLIPRKIIIKQLIINFFVENLILVTREDGYIVMELHNQKINSILHFDSVRTNKIISLRLWKYIDNLSRNMYSIYKEHMFKTCKLKKLSKVYTGGMVMRKIESVTNHSKEVNYIESTTSKGYHSKEIIFRELLTPDDVKKRLFVGRSKVYEILRSGKLKNTRIGKQYRVSEIALQNYIAEHESQD